MKKVELPTLGSPPSGGASLAWSSLPLGELESQLVRLLVPESNPTDVQIQVIRDFNFLTSRRNLLVSSPTNSGKTLLGYMGLFRSVARGKRALMLVPLKAIGEEKRLEINELATRLQPEIKRKIGVKITASLRKRWVPRHPKMVRLS